MADGVTDGLGDALLDLVRQATMDAPRRIETALEWLREHAQPPYGLKVVAPDGATYSGLAVLDRSNVVLLLAARHDGIVLRVPSPPPAYGMPAPSHGRLFEPEDDPGDGWPPDPYRR